MLSIHPASDQAEVREGCTVRLRGVPEGSSPILDLFPDDADPERELTISDEVGPGKLSPRSTLARAILGHRAGDVVDVPLTQVPISVEILSVREPLRVVQLGSRVQVREGDGERVDAWHIVAEYEANALAGMISDTSPVGAALLNHRVGDQVRADLPGRRAHLTIVGVE